MRTLFLLVALAGPLAAAEPVVVELPAKASSGSAVVTLGQIAKLHGGDEKTRAKLAAVDVAEHGKKDTVVAVTQRQVEVRLRLAGFTDADVLVGGAEKVSVAVTRKAVPAEDAVAAAKKALREQFPKTDDVTIDQAQAVTVKLPEVTSDEVVSITAKPRYLPVKAGRVEMEVTISNGERSLLTFPIHLEAKSKADQLLVTRNQKVSMVVRSGGLTLEMTGEAQQDGREGQTIKVLNTTSKKTVTGKVTAAGVVTVDIGGAP